MVHNDCDGGACWECSLDESEATPMTDIDLLLESMRAGARLLDADYPSVSLVLERAADTIAAQQKRIEELEKLLTGSVILIEKCQAEISSALPNHSFKLPNGLIYLLDCPEQRTLQNSIEKVLFSKGGSDNG